MQIERALSKGCRIDTIGMQFHMFNRFETEEELLAEMKPYVVKHFDDVAFTTYMTREAAEPFGLEAIVGHPKSRDLMQDKKFLKEITK